MRSSADPRFLAGEAELREAVPEPSPRILQKILGPLESHAQTWVANASLVALALPRADGAIDVVARAVRPGRVKADDVRTIAIPDEPEARIGDGGRELDAACGAGALFAVPGIAETLRVNGRIARRGAALELAVAANYMHCAKAFVRSRLWDEAPPGPALPEFTAEHGDALGPSARDFVAHAPFLVLGTGLASGECDASPRGDPPGFVQILDERTLLLPDRPGNRILDSLRNIAANPVAGLLFLIPGCPWALRVRARARLIDDAAQLARCEVNGKRPKVGTWLEVRECALERAPALVRSGLFERDARPDQRALPTLGEVIIDQLEPKGRFKRTKRALVDWSLRQDAKHNLY